jgi:hypothetical protein
MTSTTVLAVSAEISVVIPTRDRVVGLARLVTSLDRQTLGPDRYEVIIVDDGSASPVRLPDVAFPARMIRHASSRGPAAARNSGWQAAAAELVAFVDDDCVADERWLEALLRAAAPGAVVQGRVTPMPEQADQLRPLSHTLEVEGVSQLFVSANIAYPRALLERLAGFDETFGRACAEDVELGARALAAGAEPRFAADALVYHEVRNMCLRDQLCHTLKWTDAPRALRLHPELRRLLVAGVFWKSTHPWLLAGSGALMARRHFLTAIALAPYLVHYRRLYAGNPGALARSLPSHLAIDVCEIATVLAGSLRHGTLML